MREAKSPRMREKDAPKICRWFCKPDLAQVTAGLSKRQYASRQSTKEGQDTLDAELLMGYLC